MHSGCIPMKDYCVFWGGHGFFGQNNADKKVLEIGCGSGANLWMLAKEGFDTYGMDGRPTSLNLAKEHLSKKWNVNAALKYGLFDALPYENEMFDVVVDIVSLQHIDVATSRAALEEVFRVLKPGGLFFSYRLSDHSMMFLNSGSEMLDCATVKNVAVGCYPLANNGVMSFWSPNLVRGEYGKAGLEIESIERDTRTYQGGLYNVEYLAITAKKL